MAQKSFLIDLNLNGNQLKNVRVDNVYIDPVTGKYGVSEDNNTESTPGIGQLAFDLTDNKFKYCIGESQVTLGTYIWKTSSGGGSSSSFESAYDAIPGVDIDGSEDTTALITRYYNSAFEGLEDNPNKKFNEADTNINDVSISTDIVSNITANFKNKSYNDIRKLSYNELLTMLLFQDSPATSSNVAVSLSISPNALKFVGTTQSLSLTAKYTPAKWTNGDKTTTNKTAATATSIKIADPDSLEVANVTDVAQATGTSPSYLVKAGANTFTATVVYAGSGIAGKSAFGNPSGDAISTSTTATKTATASFDGVYPILSNGTVVTTTNKADNDQHEASNDPITSMTLTETATPIKSGTVLYFRTKVESDDGNLKWCIAIPTAYGTPKSIYGFNSSSNTYSVPSSYDTTTKSYTFDGTGASGTIASNVSYTMLTNNNGAKMGATTFKIEF